MEEIKKAKLRALRILTKMDKTRKELSDALIRAGFSEEAVRAALEYVTSYGYLDDKKYAGKYVECYKDRKSLRKIRFELMKKGVEKDLVAGAIENCEDLDERKLIRRILEKKWTREDKPDEKELARLYGALARQGFASNDIWQVLREENLT